MVVMTLFSVKLYPSSQPTCHHQRVLAVREREREGGGGGKGRGVGGPEPSGGSLWVIFLVVGLQSIRYGILG